MEASPRSRSGVARSGDWHHRYVQQAGWTAQTRRYLFEKAGLSDLSRVLEPGCGTGAVLSDCPAGFLAGIDWDRAALNIAGQAAPRAHLACADALSLPFPQGEFDACVCHFFLLWVDAERALAEMMRITRPGGWIIALAEPDYGGRIDRPIELAELGRLQGQALENQGADPLMGRKLAGLFARAGLQEVLTGIIGGEWSTRGLADGWEQEWAALESDLSGQISPEKLGELRRIDAAAWEHGERILFVPTFYALGRVP